ncbi:MAG: RNA polymerase-associated protein RapA, partial [SAR86 cluster bacterium]
MSQFTLGQKWISHAEPDLAMGRISNIEHRTITVSFDICDEQRTYAQAQAPLSRVRFSRGDQVTLINGDQLRITRVSEAQGLLNYHGQLEVADRPDEPSAALPEVSICETELDPNIRFSKPQDRLFTHQFDDNRWFNLRYDTWRHISRLASADSRGLYGPRISLIPHQLYIANEVARRFAPRVLLADEVGLGKTIEAGLIVHQQLQTGRASRILIIVPEALSFQWFVEMIRRFNLSFTVLDEERCFQISSDNSEIDSDDPYAEVFNPFEAQQLMLCSLNLFIENPDRIEQVLDAEWDLVVVDEAHHLHWTPEQESLEYKIVALISQVTQGLLLLTATPEQLGRTGHFARLKLLDPHRFHDYQQFIDEEQQFEVIADAATDLLRGSDSEKLSARTLIQKTLDLSTADSPQSDADLISALLDRHGTGRVLFRNVRSSIKGFPKRIANPYPLQAPSEYTDLGLPYPEASHSNWTKIDTRLPWLAELLLANSKKKFLLICAHKK